MPYLLHIDTATTYASICLSEGSQALGMLASPDQHNHAGFLQPAIQQLCKDKGITLEELAAVSVTSGPGSYTGLRVGMASAKGICFALQKPLITIDTLSVMALAAIREQGEQAAAHLYCPMIDARRMEVFTALFDYQLQLVEPAGPMILEETHFNHYLNDKSLIFSGNGAFKMASFISGTQSRISQIQHTAADLAVLAFQAFENGIFADLAYAEPSYLKAFHSTQKSSS